MERFWEQIQFLRVSAESYDSGNESEARRLSAALRILFIKSKSSRGLLEQLELGKYLKMLNTSTTIDSRNAAPTLGLVAIEVQELRFRYIAPLDNYAPKDGPSLLRLQKWLSQPVGKKESRKWSRQDLISWVANQDGGAHVDPSLDALYSELSRENGMGFLYSIGDQEMRQNVEGNYILASIRQIAYETDKSVIRLVNEGLIPSSLC